MMKPHTNQRLIAGLARANAPHLLAGPRRRYEPVSVRTSVFLDLGHACAEPGCRQTLCGAHEARYGLGEEALCCPDPLGGIDHVPVVFDDLRDVPVRVVRLPG